VGEAFTLLCYLEKAARGPLLQMSEEVAEKTAPKAPECFQ
jgi:hypothetical protein